MFLLLFLVLNCIDLSLFLSSSSSNTPSISTRTSRADVLTRPGLSLSSFPACPFLRWRHTWRLLSLRRVRSFIKLTATSSSLQKLRHSPSVSVSKLRLQSEKQSHQNDTQHDRVVVVRGHVEPKSIVDGTRKGFMTNSNGVLVSKESGDKAVVIQRTQSCIYKWKGFFGRTSDVRALLGRSRREQESSSLRTIPFILVEGDQWPISDYVIVNLEGSRHPLPLKTVYHQLQPIDASPYSLLQALFGHEYPVGLLDEEKLLPLGKCITAVGIFSSKNGIPEIKSCKDLPYFLSDLTKDQMVADLAFKAKILLWSGLVLGSLSIGILGYAVMRRWKEWRQRRLSQQSSQNSSDEDNTDADDETGEVSDGQLCVICLMRRRRSTFIPCGHLVCCGLCAISVERDVSPNCPLCRQAIRGYLTVSM